MVLRLALLAAGSAGALILSFNAAMAADPSDNGMYQQPVYNSAPPADWTGLYMGPMLGYIWGNLDPNTGAKVDTDGLLLGGFVGYNFQMGALVFGAEADIAMTSMDGSENGTDGDVDWTGSARGRLGYTWDRHMIYGTAGLGFLSADIDLGGASDENTHVGLVVGAGLETMVNQSFSARGEYLYSGYGEKDYGAFDADASTHAIRAGLAYQF
uniref:outer membrane protein n=1 Tax=Pararhizobium sp. IMCC3301 TaxID=3067904 RepID=UPI0027409925|nr:outer membrane protein [Pararhizobium sp. IMCC3301]